MRRRSIVILSISIIVVAVAVVVALLLPGVLKPTTSSSEPYPPTLPGGYKVYRAYTGEKAVEIVKRLHWHPSEVKIEKAYVVQYTDGTIIWLAYVGSRDKACSDVEAMVKAMYKYASRLPYTPPVNHTMWGHQVYLSMDKRDGSLHVFWCQDGYTVWVRVGASGVKGLQHIVMWLDTHI